MKPIDHHSISFYIDKAELLNNFNITEDELNTGFLYSDTKLSDNRHCIIIFGNREADDINYRIKKDKIELTIKRHISKRFDNFHWLKVDRNFCQFELKYDNYLYQGKTVKCMIIKVKKVNVYRELDIFNLDRCIENNRELFMQYYGDDYHQIKNLLKQYEDSKC